MEDSYYKKYNMKLGKRDRTRYEKHKYHVISKRKYNRIRLNKDKVKSSSPRQCGLIDANICDMVRIEVNIDESEYIEDINWMFDDISSCCNWFLNDGDDNSYYS